jgi:hypothetical protein
MHIINVSTLLYCRIDLETVTPKKSNSKSVYHHEQQVTATSTSCSSSSTEEALDTSIHRFDIRHQQENKRPLNTKHLSNSDTTQKSNNKKSKLANVDRTGMKSLMSFFGKK